MNIINEENISFNSWREFKEKHLTSIKHENTIEYEVNYDKDKIDAILYYAPYSMCGFCTQSCNNPNHNPIKGVSINDCVKIIETPSKLELDYGGEQVEIILQAMQLMVGISVASGEDK